jgi:hypothetical protein
MEPMLTLSWWIGAFLVLLMCSLLGGVAGSRIFLAVWSRRLYALECEVADLQTSVLVEKKKRASETRWSKAEQRDAELEALLKSRTQPSDSQKEVHQWRFGGLSKGG